MTVLVLVLVNWALLRGAPRAEIRDASDDDDDAELEAASGERVWNAKDALRGPPTTAGLLACPLGARSREPGASGRRKKRLARESLRGGAPRTRRASIRGTRTRVRHRQPRLESRRKSRADDPTRARLFCPTHLRGGRARAGAAFAAGGGSDETHDAAATRRATTRRGFTRPAGVVAAAAAEYAATRLPRRGRVGGVKGSSERVDVRTRESTRK